MGGKLNSHWPISLTNGVAALFSLFLPLVLVRILPPDQIGLYKVFFLYVMLSPSLFFAAGLTNGLYHWTGKYPETKPEVRQSWTLLLAMSLLIGALGVWAAPQLAFHLHASPFVLKVFFLSTPATLIAQFFEDLLIARGDVWTGSLYSGGFNTLRSAALLAAAWWGRNISFVFEIFALCILVRVLVGWCLLLPTNEIVLLFDRDKMRNVLRYGFPVSIAALAGLALQNVDQMILSFRLSPSQFAFYAVGCLSIPPLLVLEISVNRVLIPKLSQAFARGDLAQARELYAEGVYELFRFLLPATLGLILYATPIIWILFTPRYLSSASYLKLYAWLYLFLCIPLDAGARARGDGGWILRLALFFAPLSLMAIWFSVSRWGATGALISFLAAQGIMRLYTLTYHKRCFEAPYAAFLPVREMVILTGLALAAASISEILRPLFSDPRRWFLITGPVFASFYFATAYLLLHRKQIPKEDHPIRVMELAQSLCLGGLERIVYSLASHLNQNGSFRFLVVSYDRTDLSQSFVPLLTEAGIPVIQWQKGEGFSLRSVWRLLRILISQKTRILHVHDLGPLIYGGIAKIMSLGRIYLIATIHSAQPILQSRRERLYYKLFLRLPDRIVAVSPAIKSLLVSFGVPTDRIEVIPNGVSFPTKHLTGPHEKLVLRKNLQPGRSSAFYKARWLLCLARLYPGKGQDLILNIWNALPPNIRQQVVLFFVGQETDSAYAESIRARVQSLNAEESIVLPGGTDHPQTWLQASDLFISASQHEGMPLAPLEAVGSGLPTLLTDIEGHRYLKPWAHYFDASQPDQAVAKILQLLEMLNARGGEKVIQDNWETAARLRDQCGTQAMADSYAEVFQSA